MDALSPTTARTATPAKAPDGLVIDTTTQTFAKDVIEASRKQPVLVDFWAPWCGPCRALSPILDRLATEFADRFRLAKLNTDADPEVAGRYGIRGIPNCKLFIDGKVADEFTGALPERALREFLDRALPSPNSATVKEAKELLAANDAQGALAKLDTDAVSQDDEDVLLTRAEALLALSRADEARAAIERVETLARQPGRRLRDERRMAGLKARAELAAPEQADFAMLARHAAAAPLDCEAKLAYARALAAQSNYEAALNELLAIVKADRKFGDDVARRMMLTIFEALPADSDLVRRYRRELASALN
jgi:putative thioredoxin